MVDTPTTRLKRAAVELGFDLVGVCPAVEPTGFHRFVEWLDRGYAGEMQYLVDRRDAYQHPSSVLDGVKSLVMLAMNYHSGPTGTLISSDGNSSDGNSNDGNSNDGNSNDGNSNDGNSNDGNSQAGADSVNDPARQVKCGGDGNGRVASYAWGTVDYHDLIHKRLKALKRQSAEIFPESSIRGVVDTAPLLEREFAQLAGLGWIGKNTLLLNRDFGSYFFLAALLVDQELEYDSPFELDHCGSCTACLDACPTKAFPQAYVLDARRCISYLTIEHRGDMPDDLAGTWSDWLFGCDVCQEVCPWNRKVPVTQETAFHPAPAQNPVELAALFDLDDDSFRERFRYTPLWRSKRRGILRNAALLLGSQKSNAAKPALRKGLDDVEPLVRKACAWAINQIESCRSTEGM